MHPWTSSLCCLNLKPTRLLFAKKNWTMVGSPCNCCCNLSNTMPVFYEKTMLGIQCLWSWWMLGQMGCTMSMPVGGIITTSGGTWMHWEELPEQQERQRHCCFIKVFQVCAEAQYRCRGAVSGRLRWWWATILWRKEFTICWPRCRTAIQKWIELV